MGLREALEEGRVDDGVEQVCAALGPNFLDPQRGFLRLPVRHERVHEAFGKEQDAVLAAFERDGMRCAPMAAGDLVFMDSRTLHKGTANSSGSVRVMLDFAFVDPLHIPGTYCGCILEELGERQLRLRDAEVWAA